MNVGGERPTLARAWAIACLLSWTWLQISFQPAWAAGTPDEIAGRAVSVVGEVHARSATAATNSPGRNIKPGDGIFKGESILTAKNGAVKILMSDRSIVDVGSSTTFKIDEYELKGLDNRHVELTLSQGTVRTLVTKPLDSRGKFRVKTSSATMGVRGTEFIVSSSQGQGASATPSTQVTVVHGKVEVNDPGSSAAKPVFLTAGTQLTTNLGSDRGLANASPQVATLNTAQLNGVIQTAKLQDQTFQQAVVVDQSNNAPAGARKGDNTLTSVADSMLTTPPQLPKPADISVPGVFNPYIPWTQGYRPNTTVHLTVRFQK